MSLHCATCGQWFEGSHTCPTFRTTTGVAPESMVALDAAEYRRLRAIENAAKAWRANSDRVCTKDRSYRWVFEEVLAGRGPKEGE